MTIGNNIKKLRTAQGLTQDQLAHTKFPLGGMDKPSIRKIAEEQGFCNARKHDSQDICFVPDGDYVGLKERYTGKYYPDGDFLDVNARTIRETIYGNIL